MNNPYFRPSVSLVLTRAIASSLGLTSRAAEEDGICHPHPRPPPDPGT